MKWWYLYLVVVLVGLAVLAYLIVRLIAPMNLADIWSRDNQAKNMQGDMEKLPDVQAVPKDMLELRHAHQLRRLTEQEDGIKIQDAPNGTYGFSMCKVESLTAKRGNTFSLEIHKHQDGIVYYVGYASDEDIEKYLARHKNFHIQTSPHTGDKASSLFEIPIEFVSKCEERPVKDGVLFDLYVTTIPELQS